MKADRTIAGSRLATVPAMCTAMLSIACVDTATAQEYPAKPIRMIVPYAVGGGTDIFGRVIARKLSERWQQQVVVDNRAGAGGILGTEIVAQAPRDGYVLLMASNTHVFYPGFHKTLSFDPVKSFEAVALVAIGPSVLVVHPSLPVHSVRELVALARRYPNELTFGSAGVGTTTQLAGELFKTMANIKVVHVPYKGSGQAEIDLAGGHVQYMIDSLPAALPNIRSRRTRAIATSDSRRAAALPDLPTIMEAGLPGYEVITWWGLLLPAGTPQSIVTKLNREVVQIMALPDVKELFAAQGAEARTNAPEQFAEYIKSQLGFYAKIITAAGIKPE